MKNNLKTLLILDLDETLIFATEQPLERKADFNVFHYHVYKRPYLTEFIEEIQDDFLIAVWSSASDDYVEAVVEEIFPEDYPLEFIWGRSRCVYRRNWEVEIDTDPNSHYFTHYHYVKPLKKLKRQGYQMSRILIVDDSPHKCQDNYGNAIYPTEYNGEKEEDELKFLLQYLRTLKDKSDVRRIDKRGWRKQIFNH